MPDVRFDTYYKYEQLTVILQEFAAAHPELMQLDGIGKSHEGRDIWLATITTFATGSDQDKPAFWVDGNIHAGELAGSSACLYLINTLLNDYTSNEQIRHCLDTRVFYICPRVNPDGAEWALADQPRLIRSSTRPYPYDEEPLEGLVSEDIDGDGRILTMRIKDPNGNWKTCADEPRLLVPRDPTEQGGTYYRLLPEGLIRDYDGFMIRPQTIKEGLDLNRNFPAKWRGEHEQKGAGPFPTSEPEVRTIVDFIARHRNICGGVAFHTYSGILLRPFSYQQDEEFDADDLSTFKKIAAKGTAVTGYPSGSAYHDFRFRPTDIITGALDDWLYEDLGVYAWTVEIWCPQRAAGIDIKQLIEWYRDHPHEDDLKMLAWNDASLDGKGYVDWYKFEHPQLGEIELGGWDPLFTFWNPPPSLLEKEISRFPDWLVWHNLISPRIEFLQVTATPLGKDCYKVTAVIHNTGWLPTYISKMAEKKQLSRGIICELELPAGARLESGKLRVELGQLEGRAYKPSAPFGWAGKATDPTDDRVKVEWTVQMKQGSTIGISARHDKGGRHTTRLVVN